MYYSQPYKQPTDDAHVHPRCPSCVLFFDFKSGTISLLRKVPTYSAQMVCILTCRALSLPNNPVQAPLRTQASRSHPAATTFPSRTLSSTLSSSKRDKRHIKHSLLLSRVSKSASVKKLRRGSRKPKPKLVTDLAALVDALPSATADEGGQNKLSGSANVSQVKAALSGGRSIASKPGLQKRREEVGRAERERFGRNLAAMAAGQGNGTAPGVSAGFGGANDTSDAGSRSVENHRAERWAALRRHIEQSMAAGQK